MEVVPLLRLTKEDADALVAAASTDWRRPVRHCPEWDAAELVRHTGSILAWMGAIITSRERVNRRSLESPPEHDADLSSWYVATLDRTLELLERADPESTTWTFSSSGDRRVAWWIRRLAVEVAIHRWDAEHAVAVDGGSLPRPLDRGLAAAGIEEFVVEFLADLVSQESVQGLRGTLQLQPSDGGTPWWIDLDTGATLQDELVKSDTVIRATYSDLLLWLTNRGRVDALETSGNVGVIEDWQQLRR